MPRLSLPTTVGVMIVVCSVAHTMGCTDTRADSSRMAGNGGSAADGGSAGGAGQAGIGGTGGSSGGTETGGGGPTCDPPGPCEHGFACALGATCLAAPYACTCVCTGVCMSSGCPRWSCVDTGVSGGAGGTGGSGSSAGGAGAGGVNPSGTVALMASLDRPRLAQLADGSVIVLGAISNTTTSLWPLAYYTFSPWGEWPTSLGPMTIASPSGGTSFDVASDGLGGFAVMYAVESDPPVNGPQGALLDESETAGATLAGALVDSPHSYPGFVAHGEGGLSWGWSSTATPGHARARLAWTKPSAGTFDALGCATFVKTAATSSGAGYLVAATSSLPFGACGTETEPSPVGLPIRVQIARLDAGVVTPKAEISTSSAVWDLAVAPRADGGAWVAWQLTSGDAYAARVDATGAVKGLVSFDPLEDGRMAVGSFGNRLVVVSEKLVIGFPKVGVHRWWTIFNDKGTEAVFDSGIDQYGPPTRSVAFLGSPAGDCVVIATAAGESPILSVQRLCL